jgi:hypothetical protein
MIDMKGEFDDVYTLRGGFIWALIISIGITLLGGGVGLILYLLSHSPVMRLLAICTGLTISIGIAMFVSAKQEQRREKEIELAIEDLKKKNPSLFQ